MGKSESWIEWLTLPTRQERRLACLVPAFRTRHASQANCLRRLVQIFTTKARRHKEKPGTPPEQRPFLNRRFRRWRRCGNRGGKKELVGGDSTRTIAAKAGGTEASPFPPAAGPRIRGDCLRSLALLSGFSARQVIGRKSSLRMSQRAPQGDVLSRTDVLFSEWRTSETCSGRRLA